MGICIAGVFRLPRRQIFSPDICINAAQLFLTPNLFTESVELGQNIKKFLFLVCWTCQAVSNLI